MRPTTWARWATCALAISICVPALAKTTLDKSLADCTSFQQTEKGDEALKKALAGPLHETKLASHFAEVAQPQQHDLVIVSGVGSVWPLLRSHSLLNNLQPVMGKTPLVMFYPGRYDGQSLRLFGKLKNNNYYRAFKLVP